jgi:mRNA interferase MazF
MKNFNEWNNRKKKIDSKTKVPLPGKKQIWWASIGLNVGDEEDGKNKNFERSLLILKPFGKRTFLGIPMTSVDKSGVSKWNKLFYS